MFALTRKCEVVDSIDERAKRDVKTNCRNIYRALANEADMPRETSVRLRLLVVIDSGVDGGKQGLALGVKG